jgi:hypothetical protein
MVLIPKWVIALAINKVISVNLILLCLNKFIASSLAALIIIGNELFEFLIH